MLRLRSGLDSDEIMVLEGYNADIRNERSIEKRVKGLTKKTKHKVKQTDDDFLRSMSH